MVLYAEDDGSHDHRRQGGLRDEGAVRHQEGETDNDQESGVDAAEGSLDPAGAVHGSPGEGPRGRHGLDE